MKIGILTFQDTNNFGACLQVYSLVNILKKRGEDVEIIDYHNEYLLSNDVIPIPSKRDFLSKPIRSLCKYVLHYKECHKYISLKKFIRDNCKFSKPASKTNIDEVASKYDMIIIGSDQVWNLDVNGNDFIFFGGSIERNVKCVTYGVSSGRKWRQNELSQIKKNLAHFETIYVREASMIPDLQEILDKGNRIKVVADPTILLGCQYWLDFCKRHNARIRGKKYILVYFYDEELLEYAIKVGRIKGLEVKVVTFSHRRIGAQRVKPISIEQWFDLISNAELLITSSYHALLFSLYFRTEFIVDNKRNPERVKSLFNELKIEGRYVDLGKYDYPSVDWDEIHVLLEKKREESIKLLKEAVKV